MRALPTGTVTMLFTDVHGSTRLLERLGAEPYAELLASHHRVIRETLAAHGGVEVDTEGDAFFAVFEDAPRALAAAADAQRSLAALGLTVRMGLHTGNPIVGPTGYVGMDVHHAARIGAAAHGGQVVVSARTRELAGDGFDLRDLGLHRLKDLTEPQKLYQLGDGEFPPLKTLYATNLPTQPSPLLGRERELAEVVELARETPFVTLTGPGGSGKTRLAMQAAAELVDEFVDGVWWVALQAVTDPGLVEAAVAQALGARGDLGEHLRGKRLLLLLDNFEQVIDAAPAICALVGGGVQALVTSREPLRVAGERLYAVEPLEEEAAVELFVERARAADPAFGPSPALAEICRRLDLLPLAIELAAARAPLLGADLLLERLGQRLPVLTGGRRDAPDRQRTLRATIEWSHDLLTDPERELFARLGVFAGSFDLAAAEAVTGADLETLASLVDKSLVRRWGSGRFGMLETVREYAQERLAGLDRAEVERRHREHFVALVLARVETLASSVEAADAIEAELPNLAALFERSLAAGDPEPVLEVVGGLLSFWQFRARVPFARRYVERALALDAPPTPARRFALKVASMAALYAQDVATAVARVEEALELALAEGDELAIADAKAAAGMLRGIAGDREGALGLLAEALAGAERLGAGPLLANVLHLLGETRRDLGDFEQALACFDQSIAASAEHGLVHARTATLHSSADLLLDADSLDAAAARYAEAAASALAAGDANTVALCVSGLAAVAAGRGDPAAAARLWHAVLAALEAGEAEMFPHERERYERVLAGLPAPAEPLASLEEAAAFAAASCGGT